MTSSTTAGLATGILLISGATIASVPFAGTYSQNFDGLATEGSETLAGRGPHAIEGVLKSTGMIGWYGGNPDGSSGNTEFKAHDGSLAGSAGRGIVFFGAESDPQRSLGALPTGNQISAFGVVLLNTSTEVYESLDISFWGEQWRAGDVDVENVLGFRYGIGEDLEDATIAFPALDFFAPFTGGGNVALDGSASENRVHLNATISDLNWAPGTKLILRWNAVDLPGQDNGLAINDLTLTGIPAKDPGDQPLSFTGMYAQDFNTLGSDGAIIVPGRGPHPLNGLLESAGVDGWFGANPQGSSSNTELKAHDGSLSGSAGRGIVFFGAEASPHRSLGALPTSNQINAFGVILINDSKETFSALQITMTGEQWRAGDKDVDNRLSFRFGFGSDPDDATSEHPALDVPSINTEGGNSALNGSDAENRIPISGTLHNLNWAPGQMLVLRWDAEDLPGQDNGLAINDLMITGIIESGIPGDLDGNGQVDLSDLLLLLGAWGTCESGACPEDLNGDGEVDLADLLILLSNWG